MIKQAFNVSIVILIIISSNTFACDTNGDGKYDLRDIIGGLKEMTASNETSSCDETIDLSADGKVDWYDFFLKAKSYNLEIKKYYDECFTVWDSGCGDRDLDGRTDFFDFLRVYNEHWSKMSYWYKYCYAPKNDRRIIWDDQFFPDIVRDFSPEIVNLSLSNEAMSSDLAAKNKEITALTTERDKAVSDKEIAESSFTTTQESLTIANELVDSLNEDIKGVEADRDKYLIERDEAIKALANPSVSEIIKELANLRVNVSTLTSQLKNADDNVANLTLTTTGLRNDLAKMTTERDTANNTITALNSQIAVLNTTIAALNAEIAKAGGSIDALILERDGLIVSLTTRTAELTAMTADRDAKLTALTAMTAERDALTSTLATRTSERDAALSQLATANSTIASLTSQLATANASVTSLTSTLAIRTAERDAAMLKTPGTMTIKTNKYVLNSFGASWWPSENGEIIYNGGDSEFFDIYPGTCSLYVNIEYISNTRTTYQVKINGAEYTLPLSGTIILTGGCSWPVIGTAYVHLSP